jgi:hypothetical protein
VFMQALGELIDDEELPLDTRPERLVRCGVAAVRCVW